jgi:hypothetical protein
LVDYQSFVFLLSRHSLLLGASTLFILSIVFNPVIRLLINRLCGL